MRENARIKKEIQQEKDKSEREAQEHWLASNQSFEFTNPSTVGSPDEMLLNKVLSPEKSPKKFHLKLEIRTVTTAHLKSLW